MKSSLWIGLAVAALLGLLGLCGHAQATGQKRQCSDSTSNSDFFPHLMSPLFCFMFFDYHIVENIYS